MKTISRLFVLTSLLMMCATAIQAQFTEPADAHATIVAPISITKQVDLNFGDLAVNDNPGTAELEPTLAAFRTESGGVTLPASLNTPTAAAFHIHGVPLATYSIIIPSTALTITRFGGTQTMTVDAWTSTPAGTGALDASGDETLYVGGTVNVDGLQEAGVYNSATPFTVTVNYN